MTLLLELTLVIGGAILVCLDDPEMGFALLFLGFFAERIWS